MPEDRSSDDEPYDRTPESLGFPRPDKTWHEWLWESSRPTPNHEHLSRRETDIE